MLSFGFSCSRTVHGVVLVGAGLVAAAGVLAGGTVVFSGNTKTMSPTIAVVLFAWFWWWLVVDQIL